MRSGTSTFEHARRQRGQQDEPDAELHGRVRVGCDDTADVGRLRPGAAGSREAGTIRATATSATPQNTDSGPARPRRCRARARRACRRSRRRAACRSARRAVPAERARRPTRSPRPTCMSWQGPGRSGRRRAARRPGRTPNTRLEAARPARPGERRRLDAPAPGEPAGRDRGDQVAGRVRAGEDARRRSSTGRTRRRSAAAAARPPSRRRCRCMVIALTSRTRRRTVPLSIRGSLPGMAQLAVLSPREASIFACLADTVVAPEPVLPPVRETDAVEFFDRWMDACAADQPDRAARAPLLARDRPAAARLRRADAPAHAGAAGGVPARDRAEPACRSCASSRS